MTTEEKLERLVTIVGWLLKQLRDQNSRIDSLRFLLQSRGAFSREEFDRLVTVALVQWDESMEDVVADLEKSAIDETYLKLLQATAEEMGKRHPPRGQPRRRRRAS